MYAFCSPPRIGKERNHAHEQSSFVLWRVVFVVCFSPQRLPVPILLDGTRYEARTELLTTPCDRMAVTASKLIGGIIIWATFLGVPTRCSYPMARLTGREFQLVAGPPTSFKSGKSPRISTIRSIPQGDLHMSVGRTYPQCKGPCDETAKREK